jgi:UPF0716 protein FxsA
MLLRLLILLTVVPLVEVVILIRIAEYLSWSATLALVVLTGALGAWLARREGIRVLGRIQADLAAGTPPTGAMVDGALIVVAGLVLVTPGVLTDLCGFALLIPPIRARVKRRLTEAFKKRVIRVDHHGPDPFIDIEATSRDAHRDDGDGTHHAEPTSPDRDTKDEPKQIGLDARRTGGDDPRSP